MPANVEEIEEKLRSEIYTALVELGLAEKQDKPQLARRLSAACSKLHALIVHGQVAEE